MSVTDIVNQLTPHGAHLTPSSVQLRASGNLIACVIECGCVRHPSVLECLSALFRMLVSSEVVPLCQALLFYSIVAFLKVQVG